MKKIKVKALIEQGDDNRYGVYIDLDENRLNYSVIGEGDTAEEAIEDFMGGYEDMRQLFTDEEKPFQEVEFEFSYDMSSFLNHYSKVLSLSGLSRLTGVNQRQLGHYVQGLKCPLPATVRKIETSLHNFSRELGRVRFSV
ncbi:MAG: DNA-binding protein [Prevotellaceae bacterium]|jgi:hypothetical protein|nr:DNA-binding protein [Prevotellaceae bacterium]